MHAGDEAYWAYRARCNEAFRPFTPIDLPQFFKGRVERTELLIDELRTPGRQVAIYGERGVGKTSLAHLASYYANYDEEHVHFVRCDHRSTYETIFGALLQSAGVSYLPNGIQTETSLGGGLRAGPLNLRRGKTTRAQQQSIEAARSVGPALLLEHFRDRSGLLILDEYDRVRDQQTHTRLAETLKHFSDAASETKIIVVGVAETVSGLVGEHESLTRSLAQVKLERMDEGELGEIVTAGEEHVGVVFQEDARRRIIALSDGFPFYTHVLCKYSAEDAGRVLLQNSQARVVVSEPEYRRALRRAIGTAESGLREDYQAAVITTKRKTEAFMHVLWGMAYSSQPEVQVNEIADNIGLLTGTRPKPPTLSNYLGPLTRPEKSEVLVRVRQGYYKFANPLMRAYVRLILEEHNIEEGGQRVFPWHQGT